MGQMSLWGATVITNLLSAIPIFGHDLVELIWGGFSVNNATLNRFFSLHYLLPFVLAALVVAHLMAIHEHGSNNPNGITSNGDRFSFHPYFSFKDLVTIFFFLLVLSIIIFYYPNIMGHSDNYIPADPMVTPSSIVGPFIFKEKFIEFNKDNITKDEILSQLNKSVISNQPSDSINILYQSEEDKFNQIVQGIFQADGHIGGYFTKKEDVNFRPLVYISQNATTESIIFFKQLNKLFDNQMKYQISLTSNNNYHIRLQSRDFNFIVNEFIPYFSNVHGDKYLGLIYLEKLYWLLELLKKELKESKENNKNIDILKFKIINLAYNLVDNPKKEINLKEKYELCKLNPALMEKSTINYIQNMKTILLKNLPKLNKWFLYGLYLGDGNFSVSLRKDGILPWYVLRLKISQKNTINNLQFIDNIIKFCSSFNIKSYYLTKKHSNVIEWYIEDTNSIKLIKNMWCENNKIIFSFWKQNQLNLLIKTIILKNHIKHWKEGQLTMLNIIYKYSSISNSLYSDWYKKICFYFDNKIQNNKKIPLFLESSKTKSDLTFISISKNTSWLVSLPINVKPKAKYFFFKTYLTKEKALEQAIKYRDLTLKDWLHSNNLI